VAAGVALMCAIALPWFIYAIKKVPHATDSWINEAVDNRTENPVGPWGYLSFLPLLLPWTITFIGGLLIAPRHRGTLLAAFLALAPIVLMSVYKDRKERYLFPMTPAAAVVCAVSLVTLARKRQPWTKLEKFGVAQHWALVVAFGVLAPAAAATGLVNELKTSTGEPFLSRAWGAGLTVGLGLLIAAAMLVRQYWALALVVCTTVVMLVMQAAVIPGYARTDGGRSPMRPLADVIWATYPDAEMYNAHPRGKRASVDLSIYLNRVTKWVSADELASMTPGPRPKIVLLLQSEHEAEPTPPDGWQLLKQTPRKKDVWWAFVLGAAPRP
jgi:hypothetical protein